MTIYHITTPENWKAAQEKGAYDFCSLETEGFIHCSTDQQFLRVANFLFKDQDKLKLLAINEDQVRPEIKYENLEGGEEMFPHIYGPLNLDAVTEIYEFKKDNDGKFYSPLGA